MRWTSLIAAGAFMLACPWAAAAQSPLERARSFYNAGQFEDAIATATTAERRADAAASAALIIARARLEQFRQDRDPGELAAARAGLVSLDARALNQEESIEWQVGVGAALFLENQPGPAAAVFSTILPDARERLSPLEFDKVFEWWAAATAQAAAAATGDVRRRLFEHFIADTAFELQRNPFSGPATYWSAMAARGAGDFEGAWDIAAAGWIRAGGQESGRQLRADLDAFVTNTLIPERAQSRTGQRLDAKATIAEAGALTDAWRALLARWAGGT
jgi:hypothetical protein